jgi:NADH dehydrogenase FAD-containing subunit
MAAQVALQQINRNHQVTLVCGENLLSGFHPRFQQRVIQQLHRHGIKVVHERAVGYRDDRLSTTHDSLPMNAVIAATGVVGSAWTAATDLQTVDNGFIAVNTMQQSLSHPNVFAVGDVATRVDKDVAHSGVHAVHGGAIEADNLLAYLKGESMQDYQPKTRTLYLLSCGDKYAIASWGDVSLQGRWLWYLKRHIDKRFVKSYAQ